MSPLSLDIHSTRDRESTKMPVNCETVRYDNIVDLDMSTEQAPVRTRAELTERKDVQHTLG
jgi:hypothetical protein